MRYPSKDKQVCQSRASQPTKVHATATTTHHAPIVLDSAVQGQRGVAKQSSSDETPVSPGQRNHPALILSTCPADGGQCAGQQEAAQERPCPPQPHKRCSALSTSTSRTPGSPGPSVCPSTASAVSCSDPRHCRPGVPPRCAHASAKILTEALDLLLHELLRQSLRPVCGLRASNGAVSGRQRQISASD